MVIELLSESTAALDKGAKKLVYQDRMRVPEYFWLDPFEPQDRAGFRLVDGVYQPIERDADGRLVSRRLGLALVLRSGPYRSIEGTRLRPTIPCHVHIAGCRNLNTGDLRSGNTSQRGEHEGP